MAPHTAISHRGGLPPLPALTAPCPRGRQLNCSPKTLPRLHTEQKAVQIFREWGEIFQLERVSSFFTGTRGKKKKCTTNTDKLFRAAPGLKSFWHFLTKHGVAAMSGSVIKEKDLFPTRVKRKD